MKLSRKIESEPDFYDDSVNEYAEAMLAFYCYQPYDSDEFQDEIHNYRRQLIIFLGRKNYCGGNRCRK